MRSIFRNMKSLFFCILLSVVLPVPSAGKSFTCVLAEDTESNVPDSSVNTNSYFSDPSINVDNYDSGSSANISNENIGLPAAIENTPETTVEEKVIHQPKLLLESNNLASEKIQAGSEREFVTCFRNKSCTDAIYNLSVSLKPADESVSLKTTSFYFDTVAPQEAIAIYTIACVSPSAEQKKTTVEFAFSYENQEGMAYNSSETAWLEVFQPVQANMEGWNLADKVYSMETITAQMQVRNTGRAPVYNARVVLNAPGLFPTESIFAGTLDAGASYSGSMKVYVGNKNMESIREADADTGEGAYGSTSGTLTLTYEDAFGQTYTQTQDFSTYIQEPEVVELTVEKEVETNSWWPSVLIMTVLFFSIALAILAWRLRRSKQKLEDLLLEEKMYERS